MRHLPLNEYLSSNSNWPKRLLGTESYKVDRSEERIDAEYESDRYAPLLKLTSTDIEEYKVLEFESLKMGLDAPAYVSVGDEVFCTTLRMARMLWYSLIHSNVKRFATGTVCELGCGYGFNLSMLGNGAYGGEYCPSAVTLGKRFGLEIAPFNYYKPETYEFIRPNSSILTVHSVEQIPSAESLIAGLSGVCDRIKEVIHLEPCILPERSSFMGMIRNRYNELIDHNHDLYTLLKKRSDIEVVHFEPDVFGFHPLNSTNIIVWRFR